MQIGMIGLGRMGASMVTRLMRGQHGCVVYDRQPQGIAALAALGALGSTSLQDLVRQLDVPMGAAPTAYTLWQRFPRYDPAAPAWPDRDRFVLSVGHASALLYALRCSTTSWLRWRVMATVRELCGRASDEVPVCCVNIGTVSKRKPGSRVRSLPSSFVSELTGGSPTGTVQ
jgi:Transketolase, thiamine diphosphate binding domain/NAD binding domain of 6-phosphogluconate dehydrogenase